MQESTEAAEPVDLAVERSRKRSDGPAERVQKAKTSVQKSILPKPKALRMRPEQFFKWARSFSMEQQGRAIFHLYRDHPVIDLKLIGHDKPKLLARFEGMEPFPYQIKEWSEYILANPEWGGSGEYKIMCTESGVAGCISMAKFTLEDPDRPPCIDLKSLVLGHPSNRGYEAMLRARHIHIPGDDPERDEQEKEMQVGSTVVGQLAEQLTRSNERLMDKLEEAQEAEQPDPEEVITESATTKGFEVMAKATEKAMDIHGQATAKAMDIVTEQAKKTNDATAPVFNPIDLFEKAIAFSRSDNSNMAMLTLFLNTQQEMHKETLAFMREQKKAEQKAAELQQTAVIAAPQNSFDSLVDAGEKLKSFADLFGFSRRERREIEPPAPPSKPFYAAFLENPPLLITALTLTSNIIYNVFNHGNGKPPQEALKEAALQTAELTKGVQPSNTAPDPEEQRKRSLLAFLEMIEPSFITHYFDREGRGLDGFTFAEALMTMRQNPSNGQITLVPDGPATDLGASQYEAIKAGGIEHFDRTIRNYHPIWSLVQGNIGKYTSFLKQFFSFQEEAARRTNEQPNETS